MAFCWTLFDPQSDPSCALSISKDGIQNAHDLFRVRNGSGPGQARMACEARLVLEASVELFSVQSKAQFLIFFLLAIEVCIWPAIIAVIYINLNLKTNDHPAVLMVTASLGLEQPWSSRRGPVAL
jgi:hypothetical protein